MKLISHKPHTIAESSSRLSFGTTGGGSWTTWDRFLLLDGAPLVHIGNVCGTCEFFFRHVGEGDVSSMSIATVKTELDSGLRGLDGAALTVASIVPAGSYTVALFEVAPRLVQEGRPGDYFSEELRLAWQADPIDEGIGGAQYYRCGERPLPGPAMLFEFVIPLQDPGALDRDRVDHYRRRIQSGERPTAAAIGVLDVKDSHNYPVGPEGKDVKPEFPSHWCLANYLIDGHHKMAAAEAEGTPITLLSFLSEDESWSELSDLAGIYGDGSLDGDPES